MLRGRSRRDVLRRLCSSGRARAFGLNRLRRCAEVALVEWTLPSASFSCATFPRILRTSARARCSENAARNSSRRALAISAQKRFHAPLRVRRRSRTPAAEELFVLNLQRAHIALDLIQFVVNGSSHKFVNNSSVGSDAAPVNAVVRVYVAREIICGAR